MKLIEKNALLKEIERCEQICDNHAKRYPNVLDVGIANAKKKICQHFRDFINTLKVKEVGFWHKQSEEDIYDSFDDWSMHSFMCLMNDGTTQKFTGILAECCDGSINKHVDTIHDNYDVDDIVYWTEIPKIKK